MNLLSFVNLNKNTGGSMSIFNKACTPVSFLRSLFFLIIFMCVLAGSEKITSYANPITNEEIEEKIIKEYEMVQESWKEEPDIVVVKEIREEKWKWEDKFILIILLLLVGTVVFLWLFFILCTIGVCVENAKGKMEYIGRMRVRYNEYYFEVRIPMESIDKCVTTHFLFQPSFLFFVLFREKDMVFLFPEEICMIKRMKRNIEISLL